MAVAFESFSSRTANVSNTFTLSKPTGTAEDDLLIAIINWSESIDITPPAGWTEINHTTTGSPYVWAFYKVAGASEGASYGFTFSGSASLQGNITRYSGVNTASPIDASSFVRAGAESTPHAFAGVTTSLNNAYLVMFGAVLDYGDATVDFSGYSVVTSNPTWTERLDIDSNTYDKFSALATATYATAGATGNASYAFTNGPSDTTGVLIAINEEVVNVTVSPDPVVGTFTLPAPTIIGDANFSVGVLSITSSLLAPTVTTQTVSWTYESRPASSTWTIEDQI